MAPITSLRTFSILLVTSLLAISCVDADDSLDEDDDDIGGDGKADGPPSQTRILGDLVYGQTSPTHHYHPSRPRSYYYRFQGHKGDVAAANSAARCDPSPNPEDHTHYEPPFDECAARVGILDSNGRLLSNSSVNNDRLDHVESILPADGTYYVEFTEVNGRWMYSTITLSQLPAYPAPLDGPAAVLVRDLCNGPQVTAAAWASSPIFQNTGLAYSARTQNWSRFRASPSAAWSLWTTGDGVFAQSTLGYAPASQTLRLTQTYPGGQVWSDLAGCSSGYTYSLPLAMSFGSTLTAVAAGPLEYARWSEQSNYQGRCYHNTSGLGTPDVYTFRQTPTLAGFSVKATATCFAAAIYIARSDTNEHALVFSTY